VKSPSSGFVLAAAALGAALLAAGTASAQREGYTYLSFAGPDVALVSPADEDSSARVNMPVLPGDSLVTANGSRAEAVLSDGNVVRLDTRSELRFEKLNRTYEADDDHTVLALARGSVAVEVREVLPADRALRLDTGDATILSPSRSFFRVDAGRRGTEIYVLAGRVEVNARGGRALLRAGEYAFVSGDSEIEVETAAAPGDRFTRFLEERRERADRRDVTRYVGSEYAYDSDAAGLDENGSWTYIPDAGTYAWRPNVPAGWTPYSLGTWRWTPAGMTWVSYEPWGWLPYHYGTWVYDPVLGWYWLPGDAYSPAWVYWSFGFDWTGWCPVGWYGGYYGGSGGGGPDPVVRSSRPTSGHELGGPWIPNLRGRVEVTQIDRRGWNFAPTSRIGSRLETRDVTRGDRVAFPRGTTVVVTPAPLRVERGAGAPASVAEAIRRTSSSDAPARVAGNDGLVSILRRDRVLDAAGREELRRAVSGSRAARSGSAADAGRRSRADDGWRASATIRPAPVERRGGGSPAAAGDSGWRAPAPRVIERSSERPAHRRDDGPSRGASSAPPRGGEIRSAPAPARSAPSGAAPSHSAPSHSAPSNSAPSHAAPSSPPSSPPHAPAAQAPAAAARQR
jgi:hypothetical protein